MWKKITHTFELVKFSHTIFALPFALAAYFIATQGRLEPRIFFWVLLCLVLARTAAMAFNRLMDSSLDSKNPRTKDRHLPAGLLSKPYVITLTVVAGAGFILSAAQLNRLALLLSPFCLGILFFYSLTKRFTHYTQLFLGLSLAVAPIGATIAVTGHISFSSLILGSGVLFWVAGFDLLYSLQDLQFDREQGLYSLPVKLGTRNSFILAMIFHGLFLVALLTYGWLENLGAVYWAGLSITAAFLFWQHWLLKTDLSKIQAAFFTANGLLSVFFLVFVLGDLYIPR